MVASGRRSSPLVVAEPRTAHGYPKIGVFRTGRPPKDMFHGDRTVILKDPSGHVWVLLTHIEDVSEEELRRRLTAAG
ncbi:hypothetical protein AB0E81_28590 [Streptomyces sp. NPDC033538]|uniref:hypothetical protein n=1 Tax=Streptomyces sp. NPDC033538 TaxID=3155367 RepID=UPI0033E5F7A0